jgi:hypothetical protein
MLIVLMHISLDPCYLTYLVANISLPTLTRNSFRTLYTAWISTIIGARLHDVVGHGKMLLVCTIGMAIVFRLLQEQHASMCIPGARWRQVFQLPSFMYWNRGLP